MNCRLAAMTYCNLPWLGEVSNMPKNCFLVLHESSLWEDNNNNNNNIHIHIHKHIHIIYNIPEKKRNLQHSNFFQHFKINVPHSIFQGGPYWLFMGKGICSKCYLNYYSQRIHRNFTFFHTYFTLLSLLKMVCTLNNISHPATSICML